MIKLRSRCPRDRSAFPDRGSMWQRSRRAGPVNLALPPKYLTHRFDIAVVGCQGRRPRGLDDTAGAYDLHNQEQ